LNNNLQVLNIIDKTIARRLEQVILVSQIEGEVILVSQIEGGDL